MAKKTSLILVLSDLHVGSNHALAPRKYIGIDDKPISFTPVMSWFADRWAEMLEWANGIAGRDDYVVLLNGDLIEGVHHGGHELWSTEATDHTSACIELIEASFPKRRTIIVEGTECHTRLAEHTIARRLGSIRPADADPKSQRWAHQRADIIFNDRRIVAQHHISTSSRIWTEATAVGSSLANEVLSSCANQEEIPPSILISAHRHRAGIYRSPLGISIVTGPWQGLTRHGRKVVPSARCQPTAAFIDSRGSNLGELPAVHEFIRQSPTARSIVL